VSVRAYSSLMRGKKIQQQGRKNWLIRGLIRLLAGVLVLIIALVVAVNYFINEDYLVEQLEGSISSEVSIEEVELSIFSSPTRLTLKNVRLTAKEGDERARGAEVKVDHVELSVNLWKLLSKRIEVASMTVYGASVRGTVYEEGGSSLEALFESPDQKKKQRRKNKNLERPQSQRMHDQDKNEGGGFNVFDHDDFIASLGGFHLKNASADITIEKSGLRIQCRDFNLSLDALEIDPKRLQDTDSVKMTISFKSQFDSTEGWHYGDLNVQGAAASRLFNAQTGDLEPDVEGSFDLGDDSWLNTRIPIITEAWGKLDKLEKIGVRIAPLPERATFGRSQSVAAHYHLGKVTVRESLSIWVDDWEVAILESSWLQTETDQHVIHAELLASKNASAKFYGLIAAAIDFLPRDIRDVIARDMKKNLFRDDRFLVKVKSKGELSHPKIRLVDGIPDFGKAAEKAGKDLLLEKAGGLLDGLFGR